jgi:hypothetical protein
MSDTYCEKSYSGRHQPRYDEGAIQFREKDERKAQCQHCGVNIERAHRKSAWWHATPAALASLLRGVPESEQPK